MKKVLIIAAFWPYRHSSIRTLPLARYLSEFGWQPIIVTPYRDVLRVWKRLLRLNPEEDLRK